MRPADWHGSRFPLLSGIAVADRRGVKVPMPELFPNLAAYVLSALVIAGATLIYATVGFGAGMFAVALLAMILPDFTGAVAVVLLLTFVTEVSVLLRVWRQARHKLLLGLLPTMAIGIWLGTQLLVLGNVDWLKRALGLVVLAAGAWFLYDERREPAAEEGRDVPNPRASENHRRRSRWIDAPVGLLSGVLTGLFGTGGPPVIVLLRGYRLSKGAFRATLLSYFLLMSLFRAGNYLWVGLLTWDVGLAALWLLPATLVGVLAGMIAHHRLSERAFGIVVAVVLMLLGVLLMVGVRRAA